MKRICELVFGSALALSAFAYSADQEKLPLGLRNFLEKPAGLTQSAIASVIAGRAVAKLMDTERDDEVAIVGVARIYVPVEFFIAQFRDVAAFERGSGVLAMDRFHSPPVASNVAALSIDTEDLEDIHACKPGDCDVKLSDRIMQELQSTIPWGTPQAFGRADGLVRQAFVDYVAKYQALGDAALTVYNDHEKAQSVRNGLHLSGRVLVTSRSIA